MVRVYKTANAYDDINPWWEPTTLFMTELCNNNKNLPMRISCFNYTNSGAHKEYGSAIVTTRDIEMMGDKKILKLENKKGSLAGYIQFNQFQMDMRPSLLEFLSNGWQMNVSIAVDYTLSNLEVNDLNSLHHLLKDGNMNQYEKAIFEVCNVMVKYAIDGCFDVYGFGGIPRYIGATQVKRIWNLNGLEDPKCKGTTGVLAAYQNALKETTLAGPSYFAEILNKVKDQIVDSMGKTGLDGNRVYHVVIIVTDGNCHDMEATKKVLIPLSGMPFSAVIIGVGDGDFVQMQILDADGAILKDSDGNESLRDIVQLVQYKHFKDLGQRELALEVLGEIPDQFVDYMVLKENEKSKIYVPPETPKPPLTLDVQEADYRIEATNYNLITPEHRNIPLLNADNTTVEKPKSSRAEEGQPAQRH